MKISELAYELYKNDWLALNVSPAVKTEILCEYYTECRDFDQSFDEYIEINGYHGALYDCYDEFLETEYQDEAYIMKLFHNEAGLMDEYHKDLKKEIDKEEVEFVGVYTKETTVCILDMLEDMLEEKDITIPDDDRNGDEGEGRLYGTTYGNLFDQIDAFLVELLEGISEATTGFKVMDEYAPGPVDGEYGIEDTPVAE